MKLGTLPVCALSSLALVALGCGSSPSGSEDGVSPAASGTP